MSRVLFFLIFSIQTSESWGSGSGRVENLANLLQLHAEKNHVFAMAMCEQTDPVAYLKEKWQDPDFLRSKQFKDFDLPAKITYRLGDNSDLLLAAILATDEKLWAQFLGQEGYSLDVLKSSFKDISERLDQDGLACLSRNLSEEEFHAVCFRPVCQADKPSSSSMPSLDFDGGEVGAVLVEQVCQDTRQSGPSMPSLLRSPPACVLANRVRRLAALWGERCHYYWRRSPPISEILAVSSSAARTTWQRSSDLLPQWDLVRLFESLLFEAQHRLVLCTTRQPPEEFEMQEISFLNTAREASQEGQATTSASDSPCESDDE
jgi:hypothetical protein